MGANRSRIILEQSFGRDSNELLAQFAINVTVYF